MIEGNRVILHVALDGVLFDILSSSFNRLIGYHNIYLILNFADKPLRFISNPEGVIVIKDKNELHRFLSRPEIDIIYFHGLWPEFYGCRSSIGPKVITVWYCFGKELYEPAPGYSCLIRQRMFKFRTFWFYYKDLIKRFHFIRATIGRWLPFYDFLRGKTDRRELIARMDYIKTPLRIEYDLLQRHSFFRAKPILMQGRGIDPDLEKIVFHTKAGGILVNHSSAYTNNVLDVMNRLSHLDLKGRKLVFPIVYGAGKVADRIKQYKGFNGSETVFVEDRLPLAEYQKLMTSCTHAVYGTLRQQALGNIFNCFRTGIKVFLYRNSMNYRQFKKDGFVIFAIEDMVKSDEISTPLSEADAIHNNKLFYALYAAPQNYLQTQLDALF